MRWKENFISILKEMGWTLIFNESQDATIESEIEVQLQDGRTKTLEQFLQEDADESIHELIRNNVLTATRNFVQRVKCFKRDIMMGINNPMRIEKYSWKVEYQGRGAGHIHGTLWCNLKKVQLEDQNKDAESTVASNLESAFKALRLNEELSEEEEESITQFADKFTSCTSNS